MATTTLTYRPLIMESRAPRVGHKKSRKGCAQCKRRHVKVSINTEVGKLVLSRIRSATKKHRARTVCAIMSRAVSQADRLWNERIRRESEVRQQQRHQTSQEPRRKHPIKARQQQRAQVRVEQRESLGDRASHEVLSLFYQVCWTEMSKKRIRIGGSIFN